MILEIPEKDERADWLHLPSESGIYFCPMNTQEVSGDARG
jgi:hypothetical protein